MHLFLSCVLNCPQVAAGAGTKNKSDFVVVVFDGFAVKSIIKNNTNEVLMTSWSCFQQNFISIVVHHAYCAFNEKHKINKLLQSIILHNSISSLGRSGVASPKNVGGPNYVSLLVSSKNYNIHTWDPPISKKTFQRIPRLSHEGSEQKWGGGPDSPLRVATPMIHQRISLKKRVR